MFERNMLTDNRAHAQRAARQRHHDSEHGHAPGGEHIVLLRGDAPPAAPLVPDRIGGRGDHKDRENRIVPGHGRHRRRHRDERAVCVTHVSRFGRASADVMLSREQDLLCAPLLQLLLLAVRVSRRWRLQTDIHICGFVSVCECVCNRTVSILCSTYCSNNDAG